MAVPALFCAIALASTVDAAALSRMRGARHSERDVSDPNESDMSDPNAHLYLDARKIQEEYADTSNLTLNVHPGFDTLVKESSLIFIHVGKTGGTDVKYQLDGHVTKNVLLLGHNDSQYVLSHCQEYPEARFVIFIRSPVHRYVSAWLSRYTQGMPDYFSPWSPEERFAFTRFTTPSSLACALKSSEPDVRADAVRSIMAIKHTRCDLHWYAGSQENLAKCMDRFAFVGRTEHFKWDMKRFRRLLGAQNLVSTEFKHTSNLQKHASDPSLDALRDMDACAVEGVHEWYSKDYEIIEQLVNQSLVAPSYIKEMMAADAAPKSGVARYWQSFPPLVP